MKNKWLIAEALVLSMLAFLLHVAGRRKREL